VTRYIRDKLTVDDSEETLYFDTYRPEELEAVITTQKKVVAAQKKRGDTRLYSVLICVDDFADSAAFSRRSVLLHELYTRGRHAGISTITSVQRYRSLSPIIRVNATSLVIFRIRIAKELEAVITTQKKIVAAQKKRGDTRLYSVLICVDDFADSAAFSRRSVLLHELYTRGRHAGISTTTSVQRYRSLSPIIRVNATSLVIFRIRNAKELEALSEENSAVVGKDQFKAIYDAATAEPYSFLYIDTTAKTIDTMFYLRFEQPIVLAAEEK